MGHLQVMASHAYIQGVYFVISEKSKRTCRCVGERIQKQTTPIRFFLTSRLSQVLSLALMVRRPKVVKKRFGKRIIRHDFLQRLRILSDQDVTESLQLFFCRIPRILESLFYVTSATEQWVRTPRIANFKRIKEIIIFMESSSKVNTLDNGCQLIFAHLNLTTNPLAPLSNDFEFFQKRKGLPNTTRLYVYPHGHAQPLSVDCFFTPWPFHLKFYILNILPQR